MTSYYTPFNGRYGVACDTRDFVGREDLISKFCDELKNEKMKYYFLITGQNRMGKSSFSNYFTELVKNNFDYLCCSTTFNKIEINNPESIVCEISSKLLNELHHKNYGENPIYTKIIEELDDKIDEIHCGITRFNQEFKPYLAEHFAEFLEYLYKNINQGIYIEIDTINILENLEDISDFKEWFNKFIIKLENSEIPIIITLVLPKNVIADLGDVYNLFTIVEVKRLSDGEVKQFFINGFEYYMEVDDETIDFLVDLSCGHPAVMNRCGLNYYHNRNKFDNIFDAMSEGYIDERFLDLVKLDETEFMNETCFSILNKIAEDCKNRFDGEYWFKKSDLNLTEAEKDLFDEYINYLESENEIKYNDEKVAYEFTSTEVLISFRIWAMGYDEKKVREKIARRKEFEKNM